DVDQYGAVDAIAVPIIVAKEVRRAVLRFDHLETVVAAKSPTSIRRVPLDAAAEVAREERLGVENAQNLTAVQRVPADAARAVRNEGMARPIHDDIARVVEHVRCLFMCGDEWTEALREAERSGDFALDAEKWGEVVRQRATGIVVVKIGVRSLRIDPRRASRNDRDFDLTRGRLLLRAGAAGDGH